MEWNRSLTRDSNREAVERILRGLEGLRNDESRPDPTRAGRRHDGRSRRMPTSWTRSRWTPSRPLRSRCRRKTRQPATNPIRWSGAGSARIGSIARIGHRDGERLPCRADRGPRAAGRHQDPPARAGRRGDRAAVPRRDPRPGRAGQAPPYRRAARRRHHRGRPALFRDGVRRRPADRRIRRRSSAGRPGAAAALRPGLRRRPVRAPACGDPRQPGAGPHPGHGRRRAEADRLRGRQVDRSRVRWVRRPDAGIRQPRTGHGRAAHDGQRRLCPRRGALPAPDGPRALSARTQAAAEVFQAICEQAPERPSRAVVRRPAKPAASNEPGASLPRRSPTIRTPWRSPRPAGLRRPG